METNNFNIAIMIDSSMDETFPLQIARWLKTFSDDLDDSYYEIIDIKNYQQFLSNGGTDPKELETWNEKIHGFDGFIFVVQEFSHQMLATFRNALLVNKKLWYKKVAGIISYGSSNGDRAINYLKDVFLEVHLTTIRKEVLLAFANDFPLGIFEPHKLIKTEITELMLQVNSWGKAAIALR